MRCAVRSEDIQKNVWVSERESGEMPERSGHCIQGMRLRGFHCLPHRARRRSRVSICKSGNLLGMWEALPVERNTPNWQTSQSFQTWVVEMKLIWRNVVSRAMNIHNIPPWVQVFGVAAPEISGPRTERHSAGDLYDYTAQLLTVLRNTVRGCVFVCWLESGRYLLCWQMSFLFYGVRGIDLLNEKKIHGFCRFSCLVL